jgi:hypothetical protein
MRKLALLLVAAVCVGAGVAYAATTLSADGGTIVCVNDKSNGVNGRFVSSASDCRANESVHTLVGPGGSVAHAAEADHATNADHATTADDADTLDGMDSSEFMSGYIRESASVTTAPLATVSWDSNCDPGLEALSFGVGVTNLGSLNPPPTVESDGERDDVSTGHWFIVIRNNDPDTAMQTFAHSQCFTAPGTASATVSARAASTASGPVAKSDG